MKSSNVHRDSKCYVSYPSNNCDPENLPIEDVKLGNPQQLEQSIGIGMKKENLTSVIDLFAWLDVEVSELTALKGAVSRNNLEMKEYRHICYLFECAYTLAIETRRNL